MITAAHGLPARHGVDSAPAIRGLIGRSREVQRRPKRSRPDRAPAPARSAPLAAASPTEHLPIGQLPRTPAEGARPGSITPRSRSAGPATNGEPTAPAAAGPAGRRQASAPRRCSERSEASSCAAAADSRSGAAPPGARPSTRDRTGGGGQCASKYMQEGGLPDPGRAE